MAALRQKSVDIKGPYSKLFSWQASTKDVLLTHTHGAQIRARPSSHTYVCHKGGQGDWSKWAVHILSSTGSILSNGPTSKKMMTTEKEDHDTKTSDGDPIISTNTGSTPKKEMTIMPNGNENGAAMLGSPDALAQLSAESHARITAVDSRQKQRERDRSKAIRVRFENLKTMKYLRISKKSNAILCDDEGVSKFSIFLAHTSLDKDGRPDGSIELESEAFAGVFVVVRAHEGVAIVKDALKGENVSSKIYVYSHSRNDDDAELFTKLYVFDEDGQVVIRHPHEGMIGVIDGKLTDEGTKERHSQWHCRLADSGTSNGGIKSTSTGPTDSGKDVLCEFQNVETGGFLGIDDGRNIILSPESSKFTKFKVNTSTKTQFVKLESNEVKGAFVAVREEGVVASRAGPHCQMRILTNE